MSPRRWNFVSPRSPARSPFFGRNPISTVGGLRVVRGPAQEATRQERLVLAREDFVAQRAVIDEVLLDLGQIVKVALPTLWLPHASDRTGLRAPILHGCALPARLRVRRIAVVSRTYRALISVPISAVDDAEARTKADELAGRTVDGHVELVGEVHADELMIRRVVHAEALLLRQLPADWKP